MNVYTFYEYFITTHILFLCRVVHFSDYILTETQALSRIVF